MSGGQGGPGGGDEQAPRPEGERDFGDSAGYGHGGSTLDYHEVTGEDPDPLPRPNPLDAVVRTGDEAPEPEPGKSDG